MSDQEKQQCKAAQSEWQAADTLETLLLFTSWEMVKDA